MHPFAFLGLLIGQITDFPALSYTPTRGVDRAVLMPLYSSNIPSMSNLPCMFTNSTVFHYKKFVFKLKKKRLKRAAVCQIHLRRDLTRKQLFLAVTQNASFSTLYQPISCRRKNIERNRS